MVKTLVFREGKLTSAITVEKELTSPLSQTPFLAFIRGKAEVGPVFQKLGFLNKVQLNLDRMCTQTWGKLVSFSRCFILFYVAKISNFKSAEKKWTSTNSKPSAAKHFTITTNGFRAAHYELLWHIHYQLVYSGLSNLNLNTRTRLHLEGLDKKLAMCSLNKASKIELQIVLNL